MGVITVNKMNAALHILFGKETRMIVQVIPLRVLWGKPTNSLAGTGMGQACVVKDTALTLLPHQEAVEKCTLLVGKPKTSSGRSEKQTVLLG